MPVYDLNCRMYGPPERVDMTRNQKTILPTAPGPGFSTPDGQRFPGPARAGAAAVDGVANDSRGDRPNGLPFSRPGEGGPPQRPGPDAASASLPPARSARPRDARHDEAVRGRVATGGRDAAADGGVTTAAQQALSQLTLKFSSLLSAAVESHTVLPFSISIW